MYALATSEGPRLAGAFMRNVKTILSSPAEGGSNTSTTVQLQAKALDPLRRAVAISFVLDKLTTYSSPDLQTSPNVGGTGWADTPISWTSAAIANGAWYFRARAVDVKVGAGPYVTGRFTSSRSFVQAGGAGITRTLYLYVNKGVESVIAGQGANARCLFLYVNRSYTNAVEARALSLYAAARDLEVFPYLNHLSPEEQYVGGQVDLFGDGFGELLEVAAGATITVDSVNGGYVAGNAVDRSTGSWVSNSNRANAWIRFTFGATKRIYAISLEGAGNNWGVPRFLFSSGGEVGGVYAVPDGANDGAEYPCGGRRLLYVLPTPRDTTYVEIRGPVGDGTTFVGFYEVWIYEQSVPAQAAETARAVLNLGLLSEQNMGIVSWQNRSPNLWPANSGVPLLAAGTVTVPAGAVSGLVHVEEST